MFSLLEEPLEELETARLLSEAARGWSGISTLDIVVALGWVMGCSPGVSRRWLGCWWPRCGWCRPPMTRRRVSEDVRQKLGWDLSTSLVGTSVVLHRRVLDDRLRVLVVASEITTCRRPGKITLRQWSLGDVFCRESEN
jgi:hypothetical protein